MTNWTIERPGNKEYRLTILVKARNNTLQNNFLYVDKNETRLQQQKH